MANRRGLVCLACAAAVFAAAVVWFDSPRDAPLGWGGAVGDVALVPEEGALWEPALGRHFAPLAGSQFGATIPRERDISRARFEELAARGQPFVITDAGRDLGLVGVACSDFAAAWPNASMRAEYLDPAQTGAEWGIFRDEAEQENKIRLSNPLWWTTHRGAAQRRGSEHHMAAEEAPHGGGRGLAAPYIWHVKDQEPLPTKRSVQARWRVPYFARRSVLNAWEASESFEFWFSLPGGGTMAHGDAYCELTVSIQLRGKKRWRLMMMPGLENATEALDTRDGGVYSSEKTHSCRVAEGDTHKISSTRERRECATRCSTPRRRI